MIDPLHYRVLELSRRHKIGHLSSNLTSVGIIDEIYRAKRPGDQFVLSSGHAGLALYVNLERHEGRDAEALYLKYRTHPHRAPEEGVHASSGSLGSAITLALGMALADRSRDVYCLFSDGEAFEGSVWETLLIKGKHRLYNLKLYLNDNGHSCVEDITAGSTSRFAAMEAAAQIMYNRHDGLQARYTRPVYDLYPFLRGVEGHYHQLTDEDWAWVEANR